MIKIIYTNTRLIYWKCLKLIEQLNAPRMIFALLFSLSTFGPLKKVAEKLLLKLLHDWKLICFESFSDRRLGRRTFFIIQVLFVLERLTYMKIFRSTSEVRTTSTINNKHSSMMLIILKCFMETSSVSILVPFWFL